MMNWSLGKEIEQLATQEPLLRNLPEWQKEYASQSRLSEGPNVLSFDCGMKNLSYILMEDTVESADPAKKKAELAVILWVKVDLKAVDIQRAAENMVKHFDSRPWMIRADEVVIEGQVPSNVAMKALSHCIQVYFITRTTTMFMMDLSFAEQKQQLERRNSASKRMPVEFVRPGSKFDAIPKEAIAEYEEANRLRQQEELLKKKRGRQRVSEESPKEKAVRLCAIMLKKRFGLESGEYQFFLQNWVKADDLADCFLQAHYKLVVNRERRRKKQKMKNLIMINLDDDVAETETTSATSFIHHNNEPMLRLADMELDSHMVFYSPQYREYIIDVSNVEMVRSRRVHRLLYEGIHPEHGLVEVEYVGTQHTHSESIAILANAEDPELVLTES
jgi:hypothetical protein